jgi:hypothetical protein
MIGCRVVVELADGTTAMAEEVAMIRKLSSGLYRLYSRKKNPKTGRRRNLGTFRNPEGGTSPRARRSIL